MKQISSSLHHMNECDVPEKTALGYENWVSLFFLMRNNTFLTLDRGHR